MMIAQRAGVACVSLAVLVALGSLPSEAQDTSPPKTAAGSSAPVSKRAYDPSRRVPAYFGQINLTVEQKETIYKIRAKHQQKIDALKQQVAEVQAQSLNECESILTDIQKQQLESRRKAAVKSAKKGDEAKPATESN
jgi:Spy/CpxP family protein refolding chaperone